MAKGRTPRRIITTSSVLRSRSLSLKEPSGKHTELISSRFFRMKGGPQVRIGTAFDLIPKATRVAWDLKQKDIEQDLPGTTRNKFLYNLSRASYEKAWGKDYRRPTIGEKALAFLIRVLPKIGPLKIITFRTPTPEAEKLFENSLNVTVDRYRLLLTGRGWAP